MESGDVSKKPARHMEQLFRGDLFSKENMSRSTWSLLVIAVVLSAWGPVTAGALTGKAAQSVV